MDKNSETRHHRWVDESLAILNPGDEWHPDVSDGLLRLKQSQVRGTWFSKRWVFAATGAVVVCLCLMVLHSPKVLVHRCLVNFWATWCEGCQVEIPWFVEFQKEYQARGLVVIGISMDDDGWKSVRPWLKEKNVNYPIVIGNERLGKQYGLDGMPLTALVDREGRIADVHPGLVDKAATQQKIRALLQESFKDSAN